MSIFEIGDWANLFVMVGGAAAAIAGLIFVAVSLNHEQVLSSPNLPPIAAQTLGLPIVLVLLSVVMLTPGQPEWAIGAEVAVLGAGSFAFVTVLNARNHRHDARLWWTVSRVLMGALATVPALIGGVWLLAGWGGALYWLALEIVLAILVAIYFAWILLIEIRR